MPFGTLKDAFYAWSGSIHAKYGSKSRWKFERLTQRTRHDVNMEIETVGLSPLKCERKHGVFIVLFVEMREVKLKATHTYPQRSLFYLIMAPPFACINKGIFMVCLILGSVSMEPVQINTSKN